MAPGRVGLTGLSDEDALERPDEVVDFTPDPTLYLFESMQFDSKVDPVHYVNEGQGPTVLAVHGNPDWSVLQRKIIRMLGPEVRCVAPAFPGFGLSVHPEGHGNTPAEHAEVGGEFVDHLDLRHMVIMGQNQGGPSGTDVASLAPERVVRLVVANIWFWPGDDRWTKVFRRGMGGPPMQMLIKRRNFFVSTLMRRMLQVKQSDNEFADYADVVPSPRSREGIAVLPKEIVNPPPWLGEQEERVGDTMPGNPRRSYSARTIRPSPATQ